MLFSIIVPMYNVDAYAKQCINSILSQAFKDFELILVDDGSTDKTGVIIDEYAEEDNRIRPIHKENGGLVSARKTGVKVAKGDYVVIVDGDDWVDSDYLHNASKVINQNHPDIVTYNYYTDDGEHCRISKVDNHNLLYGLNTLNDISTFVESILLRSFPAVWSKIMKRELYVEQQLRVNDKITMGEDGMVVFPLICHCCSIYVTNEAYYHYRYNPQSMTKNKKKVYSGNAALLRIKHLEKELTDFRTKNEQISAYAVHAIMNVSLSHFRNRNYWVARRYTKRILNHKIAKKYLSYPRFGSKKDKIAYILLRFKLFPCIKLLSIM